jgi:hypothetical protein
MEAAYSRYSCVEFWPTHLDVDGLFWGHRQGTSATLFVPFLQLGDMLFFTQGSIGRWDDSWTADLGLGYRVQVTRSLGWGVNLFVDYAYDDTTNLNWIQGGLGAEILGECWEVRANAYVPDLDRRIAKSRKSFTIDPIVINNRPVADIFEVDRLLEQQARWGFDVEGGACICLGPGSLWGYAGYFRFDGRDLDVFQGPRLRAEYKLPVLVGGGMSEVWAGVLWEHSNLLGDETVFTIHLQVPLTPGNRWRRCPNRCVFKRMGNSVRRQFGLNLVQLRQVITNQRQVGLWFIENGGAGVGTQTDLTNLANAAANSLPGDFIFGLNNTGTIDVAAELGSAFALKSNQCLVSFDNSSTVTLDFGSDVTLQVTDLTGTGRATLDQGAALDTVTMDNGSQIFGFNFTGGLNAISATGKSDLLISTNRVTGFDNAAINLSDITGDLVITDNRLTMGGGVSTSGLLLANDGALTLAINISRNTVDNVTGEGILVSQAGTGGTINLTLDSNVVDSLGADANTGGIHLTTTATAAGANYTFAMTGNTMESMAKNGLLMDWLSAGGGATTINGTIDASNLFNSLGSGAISGAVANSVTFSGSSDTATLLFDSNTTNQTFGPGVLSDQAGTGTLNFTITDTEDTNPQSGTNVFLLANSGSGTTCATLNGNQTNRGGGAALDSNIVFSQTAGTFNATDLTDIRTNNNNMTFDSVGTITSQTDDCPTPTSPTSASLDSCASVP